MAKQGKFARSGGGAGSTKKNPRSPSGTPQGDLSSLARRGGDVPLDPNASKGTAERGTGSR